MDEFMWLGYFRKYWFLILLIVITILWWHIFDLFMPPLLNYDPPLTNVDYWSIVTNPNPSKIALLGFIVIGNVAFICILRSSQIGHRFVLIIASFLLCMLSTCTSKSFSLEPRRTIEHVMSMQYQGKTYHLSFAHYFGFMDTESSFCYVFECDVSGNKCSRIYEDIGSAEASKLVVMDNKLIYEYSDRSWQILPAAK